MWDPEEATNFGKVAAAVGNLPPALEPAAPDPAGPPFWLMVLPAFLEDEGNWVLNPVYVYEKVPYA